MEYRKLGKTGLEVSRLCFGALTIGPLQANLALDDGASVIVAALNRGVNFIDTAELYQTYPYIRLALKKSNNRVVIATKSYAYTRQQMKDSFERAMEEMGLAKLDVFLLHEQESIHTFRGHREAFDYLLEMKAKGYLEAAGISTHCVQGVRDAILIPEIDVIHPLINIDGIGIQDGSVQEMLLAIADASRAGKGIYGMKPFGGGNLLNSFGRALGFAMGLESLHSIAVGMRTVDEVRINCDLFEGKIPLERADQYISKREKSLHIENWCQQCGKCLLACKQGALKIDKDKVLVDKNKCVLCGYCGAYCPEFCIKVI